MKIIRHHKNFKRTGRDPDGVLYCADEDGVDWYGIAHNNQGEAGAMHLLVDERGEIRSAQSDITMFYPEGFDLISVEAKPEDVPLGHLVKIEKGVLLASPDHEALFKSAHRKATVEAERALAPLERARRLGVATPEELEELEALEIYSVQLMRAKGPELPKSPIVR